MPPQEVLGWLAHSQEFWALMLTLTLATTLITLIMFLRRGVRGGGPQFHEPETSKDRNSNRGSAKRSRDPSELEIRALEALRRKGALVPEPLAGEEGGRYPDLGPPSKDAELAIAELIKRGLASWGETVFSAIACPVCGSCLQEALPSCGNCGSLRVSESRYYIHSCGYVGPSQKFMSGGRLACPKCGSSGDIRIYSRRYYCNDCSASAENAVIAFKCGSCGSMYDESNMVVKQFRQVNLSPGALGQYELIQEGVSLLIQELMEEGYVVERNATIADGSGGTYNFELLGRRGEEVVAAAVALGGDLDKLLLQLEVIKKELGLDRVVVVMGRQASPVERQAARSLGIELREPAKARAQHTE